MSYPSRLQFSLTALTVAVANLVPCSAAMAADTEMGTVVVTATRQAQRVSDVLADVSVIERAEIESAGQTSIWELLSRQPGIQFANNGGPGKTTSMFIRGSSSSQTMVLVDGVRMVSGSTGTPAIEQIPLSQVERIEVLRGPASVLYGADAAGGVIQIFTRRGEGKPAADYYLGLGSNNTRNVAAGIGGSTEVVSYSFRAGYDETDGYKSIVDKTKQPSLYNLNRDADGFRNTHMSGKVSYTVAKGHELGATVLHTEGRNWYESSPTFDNRMDVAQSVYSAYSQNQFSTDWQSTLRLSETIDALKDFRSTSPAGSVIKTNQEQISWQNDIKTRVGTVLLGLEDTRQSVFSQSGNYNLSRSIKSVFAGWTGVFADHRLQVNARNDDNSQFGSRTTGYAAYGYRFSPNLRAHASAGTAFQAPSFNQLYYVGYGNAALKPERSRNKELGLTWETESQSYGVTLFDNHVSDMIINGATMPINVNQATLRGVTLTADTVLAGLNVHGSVDFIQPTDDQTQARLQRRASRQAFLSVGQTLDKLTLSGEIQAAGNRFDSTNESKEMGGYAVLNLVANYTINKELSLNTRVNNVFNRQYETVWGYGSPGFSVMFGLRYAPK